MSNSFKILLRLVLGIILIAMIFISSLYFNDIIISELNLENKVYPFSTIYYTLTLALSAITIILLYLNYIQQKQEFTNMNELQLILYEKNKIDNEFKNLNEKFQSINELELHKFNFRLKVSFEKLFNDNILTLIPTKSKSYLEELNSYSGDSLKEYFFTLRKIDNQIQLIKNNLTNGDSIKLLKSNIDSDLSQIIIQIHQNFEYMRLYKFIKTYSNSEEAEIILFKLDLINRGKEFTINLYNLIRQLQ